MIEITTIPTLSDNFAYGLTDSGSGRAAVIDPGEAGPVRQWLKRAGARLNYVVLTHHHADHVGGAEDLRDECKAEVICSELDRDRIAAATRSVAGGETFDLFGTPVEVIATPGHTRGQVAYWLSREGALFTGDTLFSAGCGRLFEGTTTDMHSTLARLNALPAEAKIYFGHEYTLTNLDFVLANVKLDENADALRAEVEAYRARCRRLIANGQPTTPSTLGTERLVNPFLRAPDVPTFARWRSTRDRWGT